MYPHDDQEYSLALGLDHLSTSSPQRKFWWWIQGLQRQEERGFISHCLDVETVECILDMEGLVPAEPSKQALKGLKWLYADMKRRGEGSGSALGV